MNGSIITHVKEHTFAPNLQLTYLHACITTFWARILLVAILERCMPERGLCCADSDDSKTYVTVCSREWYMSWNSQHMDGSAHPLTRVQRLFDCWYVITSLDENWFPQVLYLKLSTMYAWVSICAYVP